MLGAILNTNLSDFNTQLPITRDNIFNECFWENKPSNDD
jgi:hypothetical protein